MDKLQTIIETGPRTENRAGIMLHGFGSTADNIAPACHSLLRAAPYWITPQAPVAMDEFLGYESHAWFPSEAREIEAALTGYLWSDIAQYDSPSIEEAARCVLEVVREKNLLDARLVIAGFSQGGMVATECALQYMLGKRGAWKDFSGEIEAVLLFSSSQVAGERRERLISDGAFERVVPAVFVSHGNVDNILTFSQGRELYEFWTRLSSDVRFFEFDGGHELPEDVLSASCNFLASLERRQREGI